MRKVNESQIQQNYKKNTVGNEEEIIDSLSIGLKKSVYQYISVKDHAESSEELENDYSNSIKIFRDTFEAKDSYTRGHSDRVSEIAVLIGEKMGLSDKELKTLHIGGLFHDIGKIGIPDSILLKETKLSDEEYSEMKHHPSIGENILSNSDMFKEIIPVVKYHHERYDGRGYPDNLVGENIPLMARITAVADSFDAMSSRRTYKNSLDTGVIVEEIRKNKGTQFDPKIADVFLDILENEFEKIEEIQAKYKK